MNVRVEMSVFVACNPSPIDWQMFTPKAIPFINPTHSCDNNIDS